MSGQTTPNKKDGNDALGTLEKKVKNLAEDVKDKYAPKVMLKQTRDDLMKIMTPALLMSIGAPAFWSSSTVIEKYLERKFNITRNNWGILWRQSEQTRRQALPEKLKRTNGRVNSLERAVAKLRRKSATRQQVRPLVDRLRGTNRRVGLLEETVGNLKRQANTTRQQVRHSPASPALAGETDRLRILETRVNLLTSALG
ncbi:hypothetical protein ABT298_26365 [Streptomyces sp. NPDC001034]|uniref:hypothetical protein n=1 Tax=Streptomyces sp. NPDC001034 TaxID=3154375 RepID=UPI003320D95D